MSFWRARDCCWSWDVATTTIGSEKTLEEMKYQQRLEKNLEKAPTRELFSRK